MIMMNLIVSLIGKTVDRNMDNPIRENFKELNNLIVYYESMWCLILMLAFKIKYVKSEEEAYFHWITYKKVNKESMPK